MRVFLTGASGYLGLHLVRKLAEAGHNVTAQMRTPYKLGRWLEHPRVTAWEGSIENDTLVEHAIQGQEACVHAAVIWGAPREELEMRDSAVAAKLFDAAGRASVSRTLYVSSTAVHRPFREWMTEEDRLTTADLYGATKAVGELLLWAACSTYGMEGVVVRPGPMVGPPVGPGATHRSHSRLESFLESARRGQPIHVEEGTGRQFVGVADVADTVIDLLASPPANETYLCVARQITHWSWIADRIVDVARSTSPVVVEPRSTQWPEPYFDAAKLAEHLGRELDSRAAMEAHIEHLVRQAVMP